MIFTTGILHALGFYPGDPHNHDTMLIYILVTCTGVALFMFFGFLGPQRLRVRMKAMNKWLFSNFEPLFPLDPHKPFSEAYNVKAPPIAARFKRRLYLTLFGFLLVLLIALSYIILVAQ